MLMAVKINFSVATLSGRSTGPVLTHIQWLVSEQPTGHKADSSSAFHVKGVNMIQDLPDYNIW